MSRFLKFIWLEGTYAAHPLPHILHIYATFEELALLKKYSVNHAQISSTEFCVILFHSVDSKQLRQQRCAYDLVQLKTLSNHPMLPNIAQCCPVSP